MKYNVLLALAGLTMAAGALANPTPAPVPADPAKGKLIAWHDHFVTFANPVTRDGKTHRRFTYVGEEA